MSTVAPQVPQAAGGNPTTKGAPQPEGRAHQTAGAGDQEHQKLPVPELTLRPAHLLSPSPPNRTHTLLYKLANPVFKPPHSL